jgi:hypothetical protein
MSEPTKFEGWAVVEIMGHVRIAGRVREETQFGAAMIRVDVPAVDGHPAFTRYYHPQALYSLCPCDETTALSVAKHERHPPIERWQMPILTRPAALASGHTGDDDHQDDDFDDDSEF